jgi:sugar (pentulose or hexulose) kinase
MADTVEVSAADVLTVVQALSAAYLNAPVLGLVPGATDAASAGARLMAAVAGTAMPPDPVSDAEQTAIAVRHVHDAFLHADFPDEQAHDFTLAYAQTCYASAAARAMMRGPHG